MLRIAIRGHAMRLVIAMLLLIGASNAIAWNPFDSKLQLYRCSSQSEAMACKSCTKLDGRKTEYKVNVDKATVQWITYENGNVTGTNTNENCKVVDAKNWSCETQPNLNESSYYGGRQSMANGQYFSSSMIKLAPIPKQGMKGHFSEYFGCAK